MRVLVIEDHAELAETVALGLQREGMAVDVALDGAAGLRQAAVYDYDVIVLDRRPAGGARRSRVRNPARAGRPRPSADADGVGRH